MPPRGQSCAHPLSKKDVCPGCGYFVPLLLITALLTFPEM